MTHTPGPWKVDTYQVWTGTRNRGNVTYWQVTRENGYPIQQLSEADAHLIAAAPDLLEALRRIAEPPYQWDSPESRDTNEVRLRCRIARDAIAKAEGS